MHTRTDMELMKGHAYRISEVKEVKLLKHFPSYLANDLIATFSGN